jgi:flagellar biosynthesis protein FliR
MPGELVFPTATLLGFLLTLARVAGVFVFVPIPGLRSAVDMARVFMAVSITLALFPYWPAVRGDGSIGLFTVWMVSEAALGIGIGLAVAFVVESLAVAAQVMGLQAGYSFASTIDPNTQADSGVLVVFSQLAAGLVFFATGLEREVLRVFATSLVKMPAGSFALARGAAEHLLMVAGTMFSTGLRMAFPVVAVLVMVDISLALLGRVNAQLQLLTLAFPIKMLLALTIFGWVLAVLPALMRSDLALTLSAAKQLLVH